MVTVIRAEGGGEENNENKIETMKITKPKGTKIT
jgi:hypothetical protein